MGKKKNERAMFDQMASKKNGTFVFLLTHRVSAQSAPKKMIQQRRMGAK